jgi:hypothetical protein
MAPPRPEPIGLSPLGAQRIRRITIATVLMLAAAAAVMSFAGLRELAINAGYSPELAWLLPVIIDGLVVTGSLGVVAASLVGIRTWYPWMLTWVGVIASVVGNVAVAEDDFLSRAVHATPPLTFALAVEGLVRIYRVGAVALVTQSHALSPDQKDEGGGAASGDFILSESAGEDTPPPKPADDLPRPARDRLRDILLSEPGITGGEAARRLGVDASHARRLLRDLRSEEEATAKGPPATKALGSADEPSTP